MRLKVLGCYGGQLLGFRLTSFLINDTILLDAGAPTEALTLEEQNRIRHICLSHTHLDHIKDIAFLADNRSLKRLAGDRSNHTIHVHSLACNHETLRSEFLNNHIWPDFTRIPSEQDAIIRLHDIEPYQPFEIDDVQVTAIPVNHPVPCTGFLIEFEGKQLIYSADTGNTEQLWQIANAQNNLKAVILDCSFPNAYQHLADISGHLTPAGVKQELQKFNAVGRIPVYLYHMKPETLNVMTAEVEELNIPHLRMLTQVDELLL